MAEDEGGPTLDRGGAPEPSRENRDRDRTGIAGDAAPAGEKPGDPEGDGEASSTDDCAAIDLDSARDRAS
jgi:hypothetical protein